MPSTLGFNSWSPLTSSHPNQRRLWSSSWDLVPTMNHLLTTGLLYSWSAPNISDINHKWKNLDNCNNKGMPWSKQLTGTRVMLSLGIKRFKVYCILRSLSSLPCQLPVLPICLYQLFLQYGSPHDTRTSGNSAKDSKADLFSRSLSGSSLWLIQLMSWKICLLA